MKKFDPRKKLPNLREERFDPTENDFNQRVKSFEPWEKPSWPKDPRGQETTRFSRLPGNLADLECKTFLKLFFFAYKLFYLFH